MKLELHILQNFAPSNLNRDDTGAPKHCSLGGYRRARISSQSQKRAARDLFALQKLLPAENLGARTKRLAEQVADQLVSDHNISQRSDALQLAMGALEGAGLKRAKPKKDDDESEAWKTEYLLFVPKPIIGKLAKLIAENQEELAALTTNSAEAEDDSKKTNKKAAKKKAKAAYPKEVRDAVVKLLSTSSECADLALFGRMIADNSAWNVEASCQVAHAVSTHTLEADFDFYTAIDDFKPDDTQGSDMMGNIQFNSSCFYRYAVLDVDALSVNLEAEPQLTQATVNAFVRAFVSAIPSGKQNSMAAHNPPSYVLAVARKEGQPVSLANAFVEPARKDLYNKKDLVQSSIDKLEAYFERMRGWMGDEITALSLADRDLKPKEPFERMSDVREFFSRVGDLTA